jgi:hypothetical protein
MPRVVIPADMSHQGVLIGGQIPKGGEMIHYRMAGILGLVLISLLVFRHGAAADESGHSQRVRIEKTFDQGTLITHTLKLISPPHTVTLHLSQRRTVEGAATIQYADLVFRHAASEATPPITQSEFDAFFGELMSALRDAFGPDLVLESFSAAGFLGVREMEKNSALAFQDFAPWATYLENPTAFTQWQNHEMVLARWKAAKVFEPVIAALGRAGYDAELSGFEKLFVFKADESKIRPELEALGIPGSQKLPYPGTIAFTIKARR